jgi:hypothetical protein
MPLENRPWPVHILYLLLGFLFFAAASALAALWLS